MQYLSIIGTSATVISLAFDSLAMVSFQHAVADSEDSTSDVGGKSCGSRSGVGSAVLTGVLLGLPLMYFRIDGSGRGPRLPMIYL